MQLKLLAETLEDVRRENGEEFWLARDIWEPLGYSRWDNFKPVIEKAMQSCKNSGYEIDAHFLQVQKKIELPNKAKRDVLDYKLTRYACYLIVQNGDPNIPEIAFAQTYFAMQTRKQEVLEKHIEEIERLIQRRKLGET
jgi:DNA-damage-inducible protein D